MIEYIDIPKHTGYISNFKEFPKIIDRDYPILLDKSITGCGVSSFFLDRNSYKKPTILVSPRLKMIQSKVNKFPYLIQFRTIEEVRFSINKLKDKFKLLVLNDLGLKLIPKIIVTFDSFHYVKECLSEMGILEDFTIAIDEQQCIIKDSAFKGSVVNGFIKELVGLNKLVFISATPTPKELNDFIPLLRDIHTIKLNWNKEDLRRINFELITIQPRQTYLDIVREYKDRFDRLGYFQKKTINGKDYFSKQLVVYVSNIKIISHIIKSLKLTKQNTIVICADGSDSKLYDLTRTKGVRGSGFHSSMPTKENEVGKTYQFITRCSFEGSDFYNSSSTTIILASATIDSMAIDISIDLNQIVGRERLENNVFRDDIKMYVNYNSGFFKSFREMRERKLRVSERFISDFNNIQDIQDRELYLSNLLLDFSRNYLEVINNKPEICELRMLAEDYAEEVRKANFKEPQYILKTFFEGDFNNNIEDVELAKINLFCQTFNKQPYFEGKLKYLCEFLDKDNISDKISSLIPSDYITYYNRLGSKVCKANLFREGWLKEKLKLQNNDDELKRQIQSAFQIGDTVLYSQVKTTIKQIYLQLGLKGKPTSTEIKKYFEVEEKMLGKSRTRYYKLIKKL